MGKGAFGEKPGLAFLVRLSAPTTRSLPVWLVCGFVVRSEVRVGLAFRHGGAFHGGIAPIQDPPIAREREAEI